MCYQGRSYRVWRMEGGWASWTASVAEMPLIVGFWSAWRIMVAASPCQGGKAESPVARGSSPARPRRGRKGYIRLGLRRWAMKS